MAEVRVYELAKEFGVESRTVMRELQNMGEFVRAASALVDAPVARRLREHFAQKSPSAEVTWSPPANDGSPGSSPSTQAMQLPGPPSFPAGALEPRPEGVPGSGRPRPEGVPGSGRPRPEGVPGSGRPRPEGMPSTAGRPAPRPRSFQSAESSRSSTQAAKAKGQPPSGRSSRRAVAGTAMFGSASADPYFLVRDAARGRREDYALEHAPMERGGQAEVFRARHKQSGIMVAFKRVKPSTARAKARMGREIQVAQAFRGNPRVMPVLDYSERNDWFVMPLAGDTAETVRPELTEVRKLRELVTAICAALRPAHDEGWIHRDLKPSNLLKLNEAWTVADWGITRRPRGQTTNPDRTRVGEPFGTDGWAAPELSSDAHTAGPQADIYGIGQIIGWAVTGQRPQANTPLVPAGGPWRQVVKAATRPDPARRPATVDALLNLIAQELDYIRLDDADTAAQLRAANDGDENSAAQLFAMAARHPGDIRLYTEVLPVMTRHAVAAAVDADPEEAAEVVRASVGHVHDLDFRPEDADQIITWLHWIQVRAGEKNDLGLLEETLSVVLTWDTAWDWDRRDLRKLLRQWLGQLRGDQASAAASALREHDTPGHFAELADAPDADERIRRAVRPPLSPSPTLLSPEPELSAWCPSATSAQQATAWRCSPCWRTAGAAPDTAIPITGSA